MSCPFKLSNTDVNSDWCKPLKVGDYFGEISFALDCKATATVFAETYSQTLSIEHRDIEFIEQTSTRTFLTMMKSSIYKYNDPRTREL